MRTPVEVTIAGGGLAGCEAAWYLARSGVRVRLCESRPHGGETAHTGSGLAELVCSNSLKSADPFKPSGVLKQELEKLGSLLIRLARVHSVPAGSALAVDREAFSRAVTRTLAGHPLITVEHREISSIPEGPAILATGPLTRPDLAAQLATDLGGEGLYFYDAIAPVVEADSLDMNETFVASRWQDGQDEGDEGDYLNCPMDREQYLAFVLAVAAAEKVLPHAFEEPRWFENCSPLELMVERGTDVLRHGPLRPVGLVDPRTGRRPYAVVQLRMENRHRTAFNLVGCQTRMTWPEQDRVFRLIPALAGVRFLRYGQIHRNTYLDAPRHLDEGVFLREHPLCAISGLLCGVEGYVESIALGMVSAMKLLARMQGKTWTDPPIETALGALCRHITTVRTPYVPTNVHLGLWPPLEAEGKLPKAEKRRRLALRAVERFDDWIARTAGLPGPPPGPHLVLASSSPRRRQMLESLGLDLEIRQAGIDETELPGEAPLDLVRRLAREKVLAVGRHETACVLAADTIVVCDGQVLGKPESLSGAMAMWRRLSGKTHEVVTAVAMFPPAGIDGGEHEPELFHEVTGVTFRVLGEPDLLAYMKTGEWVDKAGGYAIQGGAAPWVAGIHGSWTNVVGLPLAQTVERLVRFHPEWPAFPWRRHGD